MRPNDVLGSPDKDLRRLRIDRRNLAPPSGFGGLCENDLSRIMEHGASAQRARLGIEADDERRAVGDESWILSETSTDRGLICHKTDAWQVVRDVSCRLEK